MNKFLVKGFIVVITVLAVGCQSFRNTYQTEHITPDPKAAEINMRLGLNYLQRGDYVTALGKLERALQQDPNLPSAHNTIALIYQRLGEMEKAEKHYKASVDRAPEYSEAHNNFGVFLCEQARYEEAELHFLAALNNPLYSSPAQALENAAICANLIPEPVRAEALFRKALQKDPNLSKSLLQMSQLSYDKQDFLQARAYIQRYRTVSQWDPRSLLLAIKIETKLKDQNAVSSYRLLLKSKFPDSDEALQVKKEQ